MSTSSPQCPDSRAATAMAHAPVPQASVSPLPRSHTRAVSLPGPSTFHDLEVHPAGKHLRDVRL